MNKMSMNQAMVNHFSNMTIAMLVLMSVSTWILQINIQVVKRLELACQSSISVKRIEKNVFVEMGHVGNAHVLIGEFLTSDKSSTTSNVSKQDHQSLPVTFIKDFIKTKLGEVCMLKRFM